MHNASCLNQQNCMPQQPHDLLTIVQGTWQVLQVEAYR